MGEEPATSPSSVDLDVCVRHITGMRRISLLLDERLLEDAKSLSGAESCSDAVELALRELVRRLRPRQILSLRGSGAWEGDLATMRGDLSA